MKKIAIVLFLAVFGYVSLGVGLSIVDASKHVFAGSFYMYGFFVNMLIDEVV